MAKIVVHVSGSVAAFKAVSVVRLLQKNGHEVRVAMTKAACELVGPATFAALTHHPVLTDLWQPTLKGAVPHIELADWADYSVVVPASADVLAKLANGIADDPVTTTVLATATPVMVVPAMNSHMWHNAATQRNIHQLISDGIRVMSPVKGLLAEGYSGDGRMPEPTAVVSQIEDDLQNDGRLMGKRVIVSLGGTVAPIDPVRYVGNWSSGKMGWAIAQAALRLGAQVTIVAGRTSIELPPSHGKLLIRRVQTTQEMYEAIHDSFATADVLIMAAAVADFEVDHYTDQKIKKTGDDAELTLRLTPSIDILKTMGQHKTHQLTVGFAAETQDVLKNAQKKLASKHADMIVANDVSHHSTGFNANQNQVTLLRPDQKPITWPVASKKVIGQKLMNVIASMMK